MKSKQNWSPWHGYSRKKSRRSKDLVALRYTSAFLCPSIIAPFPSSLPIRNWLTTFWCKTRIDPIWHPMKCTFSRPATSITCPPPPPHTWNIKVSQKYYSTSFSCQCHCSLWAILRAADVLRVPEASVSRPSSPGRMFRTPPYPLTLRWRACAVNTSKRYTTTELASGLHCRPTFWERPQEDGNDIGSNKWLLNRLQAQRAAARVQDLIRPIKSHAVPGSSSVADPSQIGRKARFESLPLFRRPLSQRP